MLATLGLVNTAGGSIALNRFSVAYCPAFSTPWSSSTVVFSPMVSSAGPAAPMFRLPRMVTVPVVFSISTLPAPPAVWPMFRLPPITTLAPFRIDSSPTPAPPTDSAPVVCRLVLVPDTVITPELPLPPPASSVAAVRLAQLNSDSEAEPASPTVARPPMFRPLPAPDRLSRPVPPLACTPASSEEAATVPPPVICSEPVAALPTCSVPVTPQSEPDPWTETYDPSAPLELPITAPSAELVPALEATVPLL